MKDLNHAIHSLPVNRGVSESFPERKFSWVPVIYFYSAYLLLMLFGGIAGVHTTTYGGAMLMVLLYFWYGKYLVKLKMDHVVFFVFICLLIPVIPIAFYSKKLLGETSQEIIKFYALYLLFFLALSLPLTPLGEARNKKVLYGCLLAFLLVGWGWSVLKGGPVTRVKGFLPNPNGFALTAMMLFLLIDEENTRALWKRTTHFLVILFIYISGTSGAILGYLAGISYKYLFKSVSQKTLMRISLFVCFATLALTIVIFIPRGIIKPVDRFVEKIKIVTTYSDRVLENKTIDFYSIIGPNGEDLTSGLWRIYQWNRISTIFMDSSIDKIFFGNGLGTTDVLFGLKSHNDYLRILFETGLLGFFSSIIIWGTLYFRMDLKYRWVVVMIAVYCFTENNFDHFPAMSLLLFYMVSSKKIKNHKLQYSNETGPQ